MKTFIITIESRVPGLKALNYVFDLTVYADEAQEAKQLAIRNLYATISHVYPGETFKVIAIQEQPA